MADKKKEEIKVKKEEGVKEEDIVVVSDDGIDFASIPEALKETLKGLKDKGEKLEAAAKSLMQGKSVEHYKNELLKVIKRDAKGARIRLVPIETKVLEITGTTIPEILKAIITGDISYENAKVFIKREQRALMTLATASRIMIRQEAEKAFWNVVKKVLEEAAVIAKTLLPLIL